MKGKELLTKYIDWRLYISEVAQSSHLSYVLCTYTIYFIFRTEQHNQEHFYLTAIHGEQVNYLCRDVKISQINSHFCQHKKKDVPKEYAEIRPLVRLYKRASPSPTRENKPEPVIFNWRKFVQTESRKPSIKFSTSTALYTPPKPSYDNIFSSNSYQSNIKENYSGRKGSY